MLGTIFICRLTALCWFILFLIQRCTQQEMPAWKTTGAKHSNWIHTTNTIARRLREKKMATNGLTCKKVWKWFILRALHCKLIQNSLLKIQKATKSTRYNNLNKFNHFLCYFWLLLFPSIVYILHTLPLHKMHSGGSISI